MEHRAGIEPSNTGFADQRVSPFATGAHSLALWAILLRDCPQSFATCPGGKILLRQIRGFDFQSCSAAVRALARVFDRSRRGHYDRVADLPVRRD